MKKHVVFFMSLLLVLGIAVSGCAKKSSTNGSSALKTEDIPLDESNINFAEAAGIPALAQDVYFDYNKSSVRDDARPVLEGIAGWMKENPGKHVMIEGHCDERGSREYNLALGEQRALSVRRYVSNLGIEPKKLHTISYGKEKPADTSHNESAWAKNRRAHFLISQ